MINKPMIKRKLKIMAMLVAALMCVMLSGCSIETMRDSTAEGVTKSVKHTLYVGLNDKDTYKQEVNDERAIQIVTETSLKYVDGFTVYRSQGLYKDLIGQVVEENSLVIEVYDADEKAIQSIMDELLVSLNQESILIEKEDVTFDFYNGKGD